MARELAPAGARSGPKRSGLLRSPTQGKPARHNSPPAYAAFLQSLRVIWVFDTRANKELALANGADQRMRELTAVALHDAEVASVKIERCVRFDCEEACNLQHGGDWRARLA